MPFSMRLQTLYLPSTGLRVDQSVAPFALIVDQVPADLGESDRETLHQFGRDAGAAGVLITQATVRLVDDDDETSDGETFVDIDPGPLGVAVAQAVRTHLETQGGTLRGSR
ncbi:hypothetical protein I0C86_41420 [Plantactinospora sp. S1510]|uniref:Uncharacterized protein n=1 Tax=Plantactinospora alkalitolerans TaxID=2789879 RepID=A0ABS0HA11_9ACTN|nr:hypothetical protein [Plantactinospora alkalitolerans]MBF9135313.1 hypothetical protein [Plantactinospora alkalitolerans]